MAVLTVMAIGLGVGAALFLPREGAPARASTPPPPVLHGPTALAASAGCGGFIKGKVTLHWLASTSASADGYVVYRGTSREEPLEKIDVLPGRLTTSFVDGGLDTSTTYYYEVRATSGSRLSPVAARARAETPGFCI
jgi:hypothetical protein